MKSVKYLIALLVLTALTLNAQQLTLTKTGIQNLKNGIASENPGLQKSAIYYSGKYKVEENVDDLLNVLKSDSSNDIIVLTMKALLVIGNEKGINGIKDLMDSHEVVLKKKAATLWLSYSLNDGSNKVASVTK